MAAPTYDVRIDWDSDGNFTTTGDNVTSRRLARTPLTVQYGRDHARAMAPTAPGQAAFELDNDSRDYSPENTSSPLSGKVLPARPCRIQATHSATTYTLFLGQTDDFDVQPGPGQRSASITCLDGLAMLSGVEISTDLYQSIRTGDAIDLILDEVGWTAGRDIDAGATIIPFYWEEGTDAWSAIQRIVQSEGMPSFVSIDATNGNFMFRDRHHRLTRTASTTSQATFRDAGADPRFSWPLSYDHGWRDIVNDIRIEVNERAIAPGRSDVWTSESSHNIATGATIDFNVSTSDPFYNARAPVEDDDFELVSGTVSVSLSRTSGASTVISFTATGGAPARIANVKLNAYSVPVMRTRVVTAVDSTSQSDYGKRSPESLDAPWVNEQDAAAIAAVMLAHRAQRLPVVTIRLTGGNDTIMTQQLARDLSDRITIVDAETGLNDAFFIERIEHAISGAGSQVHETTFACEKASTGAAPNYFRFDTAGSGFSQGVFGI